MMHCTMEDLGALRAGEASVWARRHITTCAACRAELEALYQRVAQLKALDRKSTRLNSSHVRISYAVFCLKKKKNLSQRYQDPHSRLTSPCVSQSETMTQL